MEETNSKASVVDEPGVIKKRPAAKSLVRKRGTFAPVMNPVVPPPPPPPSNGAGVASMNGDDDTATEDSSFSSAAGGDRSIHEERTSVSSPHTVSAVPDGSNGSPTHGDASSSGESEHEVQILCPRPVTSTTAIASKPPSNNSSSNNNNNSGNVAPSTPSQRGRKKKAVDRFSPGASSHPRQKKTKTEANNGKASSNNKRKSSASPQKKPTPSTPVNMAYLLENLETQQFKDQRLIVGSTVYAAWPVEGGEERTC